MYDKLKTITFAASLAFREDPSRSIWTVDSLVYDCRRLRLSRTQLRCWVRLVILSSLWEILYFSYVFFLWCAYKRPCEKVTLSVLACHNCRGAEANGREWSFVTCYLFESRLLSRKKSARQHWAICCSLHVSIFLGITQLFILALIWSQRCNIGWETTCVDVLLMLGAWHLISSAV